MFRKLTLSLVALSVLSVVALRADTASAIDEAACCLPTTSRLDSLMNPTKGSDEKFFSRPGGPPNILFIIDTSGSMHNWPKTWPSTKGCSDSFLNGLGYDKKETYDSLWTGLNTQSNNWWDSTKYYDAPKEGYGTLFGNMPYLGKNPVDNKPWTSPWSSAADACKSIPGIGSDQSTCESCLADKGYYIQDGSNRRVKGNFLNYYAPRDSGAVKVLADVVRDLREVRFGVMGFETRDAKTCWGPKGDSDGPQCLCMQQPMGPTCDKSYPLDNSAVENNRNSVLNALTNVNANNKVGLGWDSCNTPLADALYAAGYLFQSKSPSGFGTYLSSYPTSDNFSAADSVCFECGFNAIILLTDGEPYDEGDVVKLPDTIKNDPVTCTGCSTSNLHKVAKFLWEKDLRADMPGQQRVATYTIGFSEDVSDSKLLKRTAEVGGGSFYPARSTSELKKVILSILDDINARNTSFSSAAVSTLQTQSAALTAVVPRMLPAKDKSWQGKLYRYEQFNEFVEDVDKNKDGDKSDIFLIDSEDSIVAEDSTNEYHKLVSSNGGPGGTPVYGGDAKPYWEASKKLEELGYANRNIWTVTDNGKVSGGTKDGLLTNQDALVAFNLDNITELRQYLAVSGAPLCPTGFLTDYKPGLILERMNVPLLDAAKLMTDAGLKGLPLTLSAQDHYDVLCTALVIQYVRGQDIFDEDGDNNRSETRPSPLGDIFHSSPVVVDPPVDKFLCDLGISNQCVRTLYDNAGTPGENSTKLLTRSDLRTSCKVSKTMDRDAYDAYQYVNRKRERLILVGANDGMVHAFSDGQGVEDAECNISYPSGATGGGTERWAFIPADLLPRLQEMLQGHAYFIDGDIMVRDIWTDEDGNGQKSWSEFRTVALVGEGRGGTHYFTLEVQWDDNGVETTKAKTQPGFRWMFPQPCSDEAQRFGKTLISLSPKPPPIGPVLLDAKTVKSPKGTTLVGEERHGKDAEKNSIERWVAMLSGGWSPGGEKGRGIYMVDVWNGTVNGRRDNLLWKWEFSESASGDTDEPRKYMTYGFAAPVAMADYGANGKSKFDGFFDTAVAGDLGGQLWTLRFYEPGVLDSTTKLINNWSGGRSFVMDRDGVDASNDLRISDRSPFYYLPSLVIQQDNSALRAFIGTGNRYSLLEKGAGTCRFDNPQACSKLGCGGTLVSYKLTRNDSDVQKMSNEWTDRTFKAGKFSPWGSTAPASLCGTVGDTDFLKAEFEERKTATCPTPTGKGTVGYEFARTKVDCGQNSAGVFDCRVRDAGNTLNMNDLDVNPTSTEDTLGKNRYFGVWVYGGIKERMFDEGSSSTPSNKAKQYDWLRLSDTGGSKGTGTLTNVTNVMCDAMGNCSCAAGKVCPGNPNDAKKVVAGSDDMGWFYEYDSMEHKTAGGSSVLASCAMWNSMYPGPSSGGACAGSNSNLARLHQADFLTGAPNCAAAFLGTTGYARYQDRTVLAPPPEPGIAIQVSKTGQVKYSTVFLEPGKPQATEVQLSADMDVLQYIYELPVSQGLHSCRHVRDLNGSTASCVPSEM